MDFSKLIEKIMHEIESGSNEPFIIYRDKNSEWQCDLSQNQYVDAFDWLEDVKKQDPFALTFKSKDFSNGSHAFVCDKIFCARLRAEFEVGANSKLDGNELITLINAIEDNVGSFSQRTIDYFMEFDKPLRAIYEMNQVSLYNNENNIEQFVNGIENRISEIKKRPNVETAINPKIIKFSNSKANEYDPTHIISSLLLNGVEIEIGEDTNNPKPFYVESNRGGECLFDFRTESYTQALETYSKQILEHVYHMNHERENKNILLGGENIQLKDEHCKLNSKNADFTGQMVIVDANALLPEYRKSTSQIILCSHGNGARPDAKGRSVFGTELYSGASVVYDRSNILGVVDENKLPKWAKNRLGIIQESPVKEAKALETKPTEPQKNQVNKEPQQGKSSILNDLDNAIAEAAKLAERKGGNHTKKRGDMEVD